MSASSPSLRDTYAPSQASWSFVPSRNNNASPSAVTSNVPQTSYEWSASAPTSPIFDLSSSLSLTEPSGVYIKLLLKGLIAGVILKHTSTALAIPFEVGKLLLRVQWVPRDLSLLEGPRAIEEECEGEAEVMSFPLVSDISGGAERTISFPQLGDAGPDDVDSYFADPSNQNPVRYTRPRPVDERGHAIRRSVVEEGTRPEYAIPVSSSDGVWGMVKRVGRFNAEGWLVLFKGNSLVLPCIVPGVPKVGARSCRPVAPNWLI